MQIRLTRTAKIAVVTTSLIVICATIISPSLIAFGKWVFARQSSFRKDQIALPMMWSEEADDSPQKRPGWMRSLATVFNLFDDRVTLVPPYNSAAGSFDRSKWHEIYGTITESDKQADSALPGLFAEGIECGKLRRSMSGSDQVAIACISADSQATLQYSGSLQHLGEGLKVIGQALK